MPRSSHILFWVGLGLLVFFGWFLRPLLHPFVMIFVSTPVLGVIPLVVAGVVLLAGSRLRDAAAGRRPGKGPGSLERTLKVLTYASFPALAVLGLGLAFTEDIRLLLAARDFEYREEQALPQMEQNRFVPLRVAERFGVDALQRPTEQPYIWNPQLWDGKFSWVTALTPDGPYRFLAAKTPGVQVIDATTTNRSVAFVSQTLSVSEGVGITDNIRWQLYKHRIFVDVPEVFYAKVNGQVVAVAPKLTYRGWLVRYPVPDGVFVVYPDGRIEDVGPGEVAAHPAVVSAGRAVPEGYSRFVHEAYAYRRGLLNKWFSHVDQPEITDPPGEGNAQPYLLDTERGLSWVSAATPWGNSAGIYKVFTTDAISGVTGVYSVPADTQLTGADQAVGYVRSAKPQYNWQTFGAEGGGSGNIVAVEPRPQVIQGQLFWMISVTTTDAKGIQETCFVNAKTNQVSCFGSAAEAQVFLGSGAPVAAPQSAPAEASGPDTSRLDRLEQLLEEARREIQQLRQDSSNGAR